MSFIGTISKQPREQFTIAIDFSGSLDVGETIDVVVLTIKDKTNRDLDLSGSMFSGSHSVADGVVTTPIITGGESDHEYVIEALVTTSTDNKFEADVELKVTEV